MTVLGVSVDPLKTLEGFAAAHGITFPLISDASRAIGEAYGVVKDNASRTAERSTFVIGRDGVILLAYARVSAEGHAEKVLADVRALEAGDSL